MRTHLKIPSCENHEICSIGEGKKFQQKSSPLCKEHGELIQYRCKTCNAKEICIKCAGGGHRKHDLENIDTIVEEIRKEFDVVIQELIASRSEVEKASKELIKRQDKISLNIDCVIQEITQRYEEIRKLKEDFVEKLEAERTQSKCDIAERKKALQKSISDIDTVLNEAQMEADQRSGFGLVKFCQEFKKREVQIPRNLTIPQSSKFQASTSMPEFRKAFGSLLAQQDEEVKICHTSVLLDNVHIIRYFTISANKLYQKASVWSMSIVDDTKALVAAHGQHIQLIDRNGKIHRQFIGSSCYCAVQLSKEEILVSPGYNGYNETSVRRLKGNDESIFINLNHCRAVLGLLYAKPDNVMCMFDTGKTHKISQLSSRGRREWTVDIEKKLPISTNLCMGPDGNTCFYDHSKIYTVNQGQITQLCELDHNCEYGPMTHDSFGNFILGGKNGNIDVYNADGKRRRHFELSELGIIQSLAVDSDNFLWIGTDHGIIYIVKYLKT